MFWEALLKDGTEKKEIFGDKYSDLNKSQIEAIFLKEHPSAHSLPMDTKANFVKINNLNQLLLDKMEAVPDLHLSYDPAYGVYRFDESSISFLRDTLIEDTSFYPSFGMHGLDIFINDKSLNLVCLTKIGEAEFDIFKLSPLSYEIDYIVDAHTDIASSTSARKHYSAIDVISIKAKAELKYEDIEFKVISTLEYIPDIRNLRLKIFLDSSQKNIPTNFYFKTPDREFNFNSRIQNSPVLLRTAIYTFNE